MCFVPKYIDTLIKQLRLGTVGHSTHYELSITVLSIINVFSSGSGENLLNELQYYSQEPSIVLGL